MEFYPGECITVTDWPLSLAFTWLKRTSFPTVGGLRTCSRPCLVSFLAYCSSSPCLIPRKTKITSHWRHSTPPLVRKIRPHQMRISEALWNTSRFWLVLYVLRPFFCYWQELVFVTRLDIVGLTILGPIFRPITPHLISDFGYLVVPLEVVLSECSLEDTFQIKLWVANNRSYLGWHRFENRWACIL